MKLIVGLGNPGKDYASTRHNAGFMAVDAIAEHFIFDPFKKSAKHQAEMVEGQILGEKIVLAKPQTFMNLSGQTVRSVMQFHKIPADDLIVIYDDVAIPLGELRIRPNGSAGGHNGMKSIIQELGTDQFLRIRVGIQPTQELKIPLEDHVLSKFTKKEAELIENVLGQIPDVIKTLFKDGPEEAMAQYN